MFSKRDFNQSFKLSTMVPRECIPCSDSATLENFHLNKACTLAITFDDGEIMDQLEDEKHVCKCAYYRVLFLLCNMTLQENECNLLQGQAEKALSIIESSKCVNITDAIFTSLFIQLMLNIFSL